ncbi:MAG: hypothetical protein HYU87_08185 [Chloroflexi bacterium]|nr:hypothetical protein [Chloroflexota bacterium]
MSRTYRLALPITALPAVHFTTVVFAIGAILTALSFFAAAGPCLPDPYGC